MHQIIIGLPPFVFYSLTLVIITIIFYLGYKIGRFFAGFSASKKIQSVEKEKNILQKENKKMWDEDKKNFLQEKEKLEADIKKKDEKLENYRKKISGLGLLSFGGSKKRADVLYSLIMENETLEQIIQDLSVKLAKEQKDFLNQRILDIGKRQRLLAEIFDDNKIKSHVQEVLNEKKIINLQLPEK